MMSILTSCGLLVPKTTSTTQGFTINDLPWKGATSYLVDSKGMTLYHTDRDTGGKSNIAGKELATWPIFYAPTIVLPTTLKTSYFSTITRTDEIKQTVFLEDPLYYYAGDRAPGDMRGDGIDGAWHVASFLFLGGPTSTATPPQTASSIPKQ